jgi:hypothetical protein
VKWTGVRNEGAQACHRHQDTPSGNSGRRPHKRVDDHAWPGAWAERIMALTFECQVVSFVLRVARLNHASTQLGRPTTCRSRHSITSSGVGVISLRFRLVQQAPLLLKITYRTISRSADGW